MIVTRTCHFFVYFRLLLHSMLKTQLAHNSCASSNFFFLLCLWPSLVIFENAFDTQYSSVLPCAMQRSSCFFCFYSFFKWTAAEMFAMPGIFSGPFPFVVAQHDGWDALCVWQRSWCWLHHFSCLVVIITCLATRTERKHIYSGVKSRIASLHPVLVMSNGFLLLFWHNDRCQYGKWIQLHLQVSPRKSFRPVHYCIVSRARWF